MTKRLMIQNQSPLRWKCNHKNWQCAITNDINDINVHENEQDCFSQCNPFITVPGAVMKSQIIPLLDFPGMTGLFQSNKTYHQLQPKNNTMQNTLDTKIQTHFQEQKIVDQLKNLNLFLDNYKNIFPKIRRTFNSITNFELNQQEQKRISTITNPTITKPQIHFSNQFYEELFKVFVSVSQLDVSPSPNHSENVRYRKEYMKKIFNILQHDPLSHYHILLKFYQYLFEYPYLTHDHDEDEKGEQREAKYQSIFNNLKLIVENLYENLTVEELKIFLDDLLPRLIEWNISNRHFHAASIPDLNRIRSIIFEWNLRLDVDWIKKFLIS
jgi:hypothetical protein